MYDLVNRVTDEKPGWCSDPHLPPCAAYNFYTIYSKLASDSYSGLVLIAIAYLQICGNHGSCFLSRCLAVRVAHDSGKNIYLESILRYKITRVHIRYTFVMCMQNDLVHGWGLDFALRRCVEVNYFSFFGLYFTISTGANII